MGGSPQKAPHLRRGHAKRASNTTTPALITQAGPPPRPPRGLGKVGREAWRRLWDVGGSWLSPVADAAILTRLCQAYDEAAELRARIEQDGHFSTGSMGQTVAHPAVAMLRKLEELITRYESLCGLTPSDRSRLGLALMKAQSRLDAFLAGQDADGE